MAKLKKKCTKGGKTIKSQCLPLSKSREGVGFGVAALLSMHFTALISVT